MTAEAVYAESRPHLKTGWGWVFAAGVLFILVGVLALLQPYLTGLAVGIYLGASFLAAGAMSLASGIVNIRHRGGWLYVVLGVLAVLAGIFLAYQPLAAAVSLVWVIGVWLVVAGALELATAFQIRLHRGWMIAVGALDIVLGAVLMFIDPAQALQILAWMVAFTFVMRGIGSIVFAGELRKLSRL